LKKKLKPSIPRKTKRKWIIFGFILIAFVSIVALYETQQELRRKYNSQTSPQLTPNERADISISKLKNYYRSHDLPLGWEIGEVIAEIEPTSSKIIVPIHFSPGIRSSRHGKASISGEITSGMVCPTDKGPWDILSMTNLIITIHDKNGQVDRIECFSPFPSK
jgi:hypothetical protein